MSYHTQTVKACQYNHPWFAFVSKVLFTAQSPFQKYIKHSIHKNIMGMQHPWHYVITNVAAMKTARVMLGAERLTAQEAVKSLCHQSSKWLIKSAACGSCLTPQGKMNQPVRVASLTLRLIPARILHLGGLDSLLMLNFCLGIITTQVIRDFVHCARGVL